MIDMNQVNPEDLQQLITVLTFERNELAIWVRRWAGAGGSAEARLRETPDDARLQEAISNYRWMLDRSIERRDQVQRELDAAEQGGGINVTKRKRPSARQRARAPIQIRKDSINDANTNSERIA